MPPLAKFELPNLFSVKGKDVLVTGGGSGLGQAAALAYASNGARVCIIGRRKETLEKTVQQFEEGKDGLQEQGGSIVPIQGDVGSKSGIQSFFEEVKKVIGDKLDVLINNSGIDRSPDINIAEPNDLDRLQNELWDKVEWESFSQSFDVNTTSHYFTTIAALPLLRRSANPSVINIASIGAYSTERKIGGASYDASKAGAVQLTRVLASQLIPYKVRVNAVCPGLFLTEMTVASKEEADNGPLAETYKSIPVGRAGEHEEIAGPLLLLGSAAGGYIDASILIVDGGHLIMSSARD